MLIRSDAFPECERHRIGGAKEKPYAVLAAIVLPAFVGVDATGAGGDREPECEVAVRWATSSAASLPKDLKRFSSHRAVYRKAIYRTLTRDEKLRLWEEQLRHYAASSELSPEQRAFVGSVVPALPMLLEDRAPRAVASGTRRAHSGQGVGAACVR